MICLALQTHHPCLLLLLCYSTIFSHVSIYLTVLSLLELHGCAKMVFSSSFKEGKSKRCQFMGKLSMSRNVSPIKWDEFNYPLHITFASFIFCFSPWVSRMGSSDILWYIFLIHSVFEIYVFKFVLHFWNRSNCWAIWVICI